MDLFHQDWKIKMLRDNNSYECPLHDFIENPQFETCIMCHYLFQKWVEDFPDWWGGNENEDNSCHCDICMSISNEV